MALPTRTITNQTEDHSQALCDEIGSPLAGLKVKFTLCDSVGEPIDAWDMITGARIAPKPLTVYTDDNGEFEIALWPTTRSRDRRYYKCIVPEITGIEPVTAPLIADPTSISWYDWRMCRDVQRVFAQDSDTQATYELVSDGRIPLWRPVSFSSAVPNVEQFTIQDGTTNIYYQIGITGGGVPVFRPVPAPKPYHSIRLSDLQDGVVCRLMIDNGIPLMRPEAS
jgi:hypothetical protein